MIFESGRCFPLNLTLTVGRIEPGKLYASVRGDGRKLGNFAELVLLSEFTNLHSSPNGNSKFDILELPKAGGARVWEVKTVSEGNSCNLVASKHKGVGRTFDAVEHEQRRQNLTGYIVFDVSQCPVIRVRGFEIGELNTLKCEKAIPRRVLDKLLT